MPAPDVPGRRRHARLSRLRSTFPGPFTAALAVLTKARRPSSSRTTSAVPGDQPPARLVAVATLDPSSPSTAARSGAGTSRGTGTTMGGRERDAERGKGD